MGVHFCGVGNQPAARQSGVDHLAAFARRLETGHAGVVSRPSFNIGTIMRS